MDLLYGHWEANKNSKEKEVWSTGNIYVNHWKAPTYMVSVENKNLRGGGFTLKNKIWENVRPVIEDWTQMEQKPTSQYGIRIYTEGAVLSPHVDRLPLVSSCIINVAQDVDEPWPLEVIDRYGNAVNVTMEPGDMVLYESGSLIHARPFPLKGRYMANIFIHFEPTGRKLGDTTDAYLDDLPDFLPPYIQENSPWVPRWSSANPGGWRRPSPSAPQLHSNAREGHIAAALGDVARLEYIASKSKSSLHQADENGWQPLHEAARSGHKDAAELLIKHGVDKDVRTGRQGSSPLNIALQFHDEDSAIVEFFRNLGAKDIPLGEL
jgi:hypothetical protein